MTSKTSLVNKKVNICKDILLVDKPRGWTSHDVVAKVRKELIKQYGQKVKVGHGGTLDPLATGVLLVLVGKATQRFEQMREWEKEYVVKVRLGESRDSLDADGEVTNKKGVKDFSKEQLKKVTKQFIGEIQQQVPAFSAKKVKGKKLYQLARSGQKIKLPKKRVQIDSIEILGLGQDWFEMRVICGSGTYMRQLGTDIASGLGNLGYVERLRRIRVGRYVL